MRLIGETFSGPGNTLDFLSEVINDEKSIWCIFNEMLLQLEGEENDQVLTINYAPMNGTTDDIVTFDLANMTVQRLANPSSIENVRSLIEDLESNMKSVNIEMGASIVYDGTEVSYIVDY